MDRPASGLRLASRSRAAESWLLCDIDFGQWGLHLLRPEERLERTDTLNGQLGDSPLKPGELVVAEFLGDSDALVSASDGLLICNPLDPREWWPVAGPSLEHVVINWFGSLGSKYWEPGHDPSRNVTALTASNAQALVSATTWLDSWPLPEGFGSRPCTVEDVARQDALLLAAAENIGELLLTNDMGVAFQGAWSSQRAPLYAHVSQFIAALVEPTPNADS